MLRTDPLLQVCAKYNRDRNASRRSLMPPPHVYELITRGPNHFLDDPTLLNLLDLAPGELQRNFSSDFTGSSTNINPNRTVRYILAILLAESSRGKQPRWGRGAGHSPCKEEITYFRVTQTHLVLKHRPSILTSLPGSSFCCEVKCHATSFAFPIASYKCFGRNCVNRNKLQPAHLIFSLSYLPPLSVPRLSNSNSRYANREFVDCSSKQSSVNASSKMLSKLLNLFDRSDAKSGLENIA